MPELPEVETILRQLAPHVAGRKIGRASVLDPRWTRPNAPGRTQAELTGAIVVALTRSGKYLIWELSGSRFLLTHLRMTGTLLWNPAAEPVHTRVRLEFDGGDR